MDECARAIKKNTRARTNKNTVGLRALLASDDRDRYGSRTPANEPAAARPTSQPRQARGERERREKKKNARGARARAPGRRRGEKDGGARPIRNRRKGKKRPKKRIKNCASARGRAAPTDRPTPASSGARGRARVMSFPSFSSFDVEIERVRAPPKRPSAKRMRTQAGAGRRRARARCARAQRWCEILDAPSLALFPPWIPI